MDIVSRLMRVKTLSGDSPITIIEDTIEEIERLRSELERLRGECLKATNWLIERDNTIRELRAALEEALQHIGNLTIYRRPKHRIRGPSAHAHNEALKFLQRHGGGEE